MFHWICPECGREISPTVLECSACDPKASAPASDSVDAISGVSPVAAASTETPAVPWQDTALPRAAAPMPVESETQQVPSAALSVVETVAEEAPVEALVVSRAETGFEPTAAETPIVRGQRVAPPQAVDDPTAVPPAELPAVETPAEEAPVVELAVSEAETVAPTAAEAPIDPWQGMAPPPEAEPMPGAWPRPSEAEDASVPAPSAE